MHIPDGFLDPKLSSGLMGAAATIIGFCFSKVKQAVTASRPVKMLATTAGNISGGMKKVLTVNGTNTLYKMGVVASLIFAAQMFNFPVSSGTSGHLIGGIFAAVILGPFAGTLAMGAVLIVQSLFYSDGGLLALGANMVNMAIAPALGCYYVYYLLKKFIPEWLAITIAAWISVVVAAAACALEIGLSGTVDMMIVLKAMVKVHMIIGLAEAAITLLLVNYLRSVLKEEQ